MDLKKLSSKINAASAVNKAVNTVAAVSNASKAIGAKETKVGFWANLLSKLLKRN